MDKDEFLAAIIEHSDDAIIGKDLDGSIMSWNPGAERIYGYRPGEIIGRNVKELVPEEKRDELNGIMGRLRSGAGYERLVTKRICKDGRVLDVSVTISPIRDKTGKLVGASTIARDVTKFMALQRDFEVTLEKLKQANSVLIGAEAENVRLRRMLEGSNRKHNNQGNDRATSLVPVGAVVSVGLIGVLLAWLFNSGE